MKIAILTERLKTGFGVDLVVHEQAKRLAEKHDVVVFAVDIDKEFVNKANYSVFQLQIPLFFNPLKQDISSLKRFDTYKNVLSTCDVFVIHTPTYNSWIHRLKRFGKVITYYYGNSPSFGYEGLKKHRKSIFDFLERQIYFKQTDKIVSISKFLISDLDEDLGKKASVSHLGKEHILSVFENLSKSKIKKIWKNYFIEDDERVITYVGRLDYRSNPYKNTHDLIKLRKAFPYSKDNKLKIFGVGFPQNGIEKEMFAEGISIVPSASAEDLVAILARSYLYFSPSRWEGFNLPFLEAQALGIPVVGYEVGAHREVVSDKKSGFLVDSFDEVETKVRFLLDNPSKRDEMSKNALLQSQKFSWDKNVDQLKKIL